MNKVGWSSILVAMILLALAVKAEAQQTGKIPRVGILFIGGRDQPHLEAFKQGLRERGYTEGKNIVLDYPGGRDAYYQASQALGLTNASQWKVYPHAGPPADGYIRYSGEEILQLLGKTAEERQQFHEAKREKSGR